MCGLPICGAQGRVTPADYSRQKVSRSILYSIEILPENSFRGASDLPTLDAITYLILYAIILDAIILDILVLL